MSGVAPSLNQKLAGVLAPVFALRRADDLGIGDTRALREFIDWAADTGFGFVKLLPVNETGGDHSPYNAISSRALEPALLDLSPEAVLDMPTLEYDAAVREAADAGPAVQYAAVKSRKLALLAAAFDRFYRNHLQRHSRRAAAFAAFLRQEGDWIHTYGLFRVLMENQDSHEQWTQWPAALRHPLSASAWLESQPSKLRRKLQRRAQFFAYVQWQAYDQWRMTKAYAVRRGTLLMGDIPFGVNRHSADVWAEPQWFRRGWFGGTPPDTVFEHDPFVRKWGQNWGIPLHAAGSPN